MGAPVRLTGPVRSIPRYLNPDLTLNQSAIWQAADAWARARLATAGQPHSYRVGRKRWSMRVQTETELRHEALIRFENIAKGMQAAERHFRRIEAARAQHRI